MPILLLSPDEKVQSGYQALPKAQKLMLYLTASLCLLLCTPMLVEFVQRFHKISKVLAFFLILGLSYTIMAHVIWENVQSSGVLALVIAAVGALAFGAGDGFFFSHPEKKSWLFLFLIQVFLFFHAALDGAALASSELPSLAGWSEHQHTQQLSVSVLLHRMLFEVFIWKYFLDKYGRKLAFAVMFNIAFGTVAGFLASQLLFKIIPSYFGLFEAFIGGALLHLVYDYTKGITGAFWKTIVAVRLPKQGAISKSSEKR